MYKQPDLHLQISLPLHQQQEITSYSHLSILNIFLNHLTISNMSFDSEKHNDNVSSLSALPEYCNYDITYCKQMGFLYSPHNNQTELLSITRLPKITQTGTKDSTIKLYKYSLCNSTRLIKPNH